MPRNIVILCDGTGNRADGIENGRRTISNVARLREMLQTRAESGWTQTVWYDEGVGTETSSRSRTLRTIIAVAKRVASIVPRVDWIADQWARLRKTLELATGAGIMENVTQGYTEIVRQYQPGDRIYIFGFSRGAYTARLIAGVVGRCGLLRAENVRFAADVVTLYRFRDMNPDETKRVPPVDPQSPLFHPRSSVRIHVLGLWDTVASLGLPLWGWWFRIGNLWSNEQIGPLDTSPAKLCNYVYHAVAMDERRSQFFVTMFDKPKDSSTKLNQTWFRGSHAGVGGGYSDTGLSDIALGWMVRAGSAHGLRFRCEAGAIAPAPLADAHNELERQRAWYAFGTWPRWHPCPRRSEGDPATRYGDLDDSVYVRAGHAAALRAERERETGAATPTHAEELRFLADGETARVEIRAGRLWNRSGIVFEENVLYRVSLPDDPSLTQLWRDKDCAPCGADGQDAERGGVRRWFDGRRRLPDARWMELIGMVAHPRPWPLMEFGGMRLLRYLFHEDPIELRRSLIRLGSHLKKPGDAIHVLNLAPSGMFYGFANDVALFYANNSGAIMLDVTRVGPWNGTTSDATSPAGALACFVIDFEPGREGAVRLARMSRDMRDGAAEVNRTLDPTLTKGVLYH